MIRTRFAPSPTGELHLGHAYSALINYEYAQNHEGEFILRFEDIDHTRVRPEFYREIEIDLNWLGIEWNSKPLRQSVHLGKYKANLLKLEEMGLIYKCYKTRTEIMLESINAPHRHINAPLKAIDDENFEEINRPFAYRFWALRAKEIIEKEKLEFIETNGKATKIDPLILGDVILGRKDTPVSYHICVTHDDDEQNISHVIRGNDLKESTHLHICLQYLLGFKTPVYEFHPLILGNDGKRLAKRDKSQTLKYLRNSGVSPDKVKQMILSAAKM